MVDAQFDCVVCIGACGVRVCMWGGGCHIQSICVDGVPTTLCMLHVPHRLCALCVSTSVCLFSVRAIEIMNHVKQAAPKDRRELIMVGENLIGQFIDICNHQVSVYCVVHLFLLTTVNKVLRVHCTTSRLFTTP